MNTDRLGTFKDVKLAGLLTSLTLALACGGVATGPQINELPPSPAANENSPAMVVSEVIRIGMTRRRAA